jgi:hypothetical protein
LGEGLPYPDKKSFYPKRRTAADFLRDASLTFIGLQESLIPAELGLMMYTHSCGTTLTIEAGQPSALEPGRQPGQPGRNLPFSNSRQIAPKRLKFPRAGHLRAG